MYYEDNCALVNGSIHICFTDLSEFVNNVVVQVTALQFCASRVQNGTDKNVQKHNTSEMQLRKTKNGS
jgi:hypothetical protein